MKERIWKDAVLGYIGGMTYVALELLWRSWSHGSMFLVGGICFLLIRATGIWFPELPVFPRGVLCAVLITAVELCAGLFLNVYLHLHVWDYSGLPWNFLGQICGGYFFLWILVSWGGIWADWALGRLLFGQTPPAQRLLFPDVRQA